MGVVGGGGCLSMGVIVSPFSPIHPHAIKGCVAAESGRRRGDGSVVMMMMVMTRSTKTIG